MPIGCKNCNSYFTREELLQRKAPIHPWPLTTVGARVAAENVASGDDQWACPTCGCRTLRL